MKTRTTKNALRSLILSIIAIITIISHTTVATAFAQPLAQPTAAPITTTKADEIVYNTPEGIFSILPQIFNLNSFSAQTTLYDDFDDYIPFRSDVHDHFSWALLKQVLHEEPKENVMFSPFSVKLALALLSEAAGNQTQTQLELMSTVTDIRMPDNLRGYYKKILAALKKENPYYTLNLESKIYTDDFIEPQQRYASMLKSFYSTDIERLHFADAHNSANTINEWCSNVTNGRLRQLVTDDSVRSNVMLMANVIYFNGLWRRPFNDSYDGVFFRTAEQQTKVSYMEQTEYFYRYDSAELNAKILRLPYKGKKFSMFILLPHNKGNIDELTHNLANDQVKRAQWMMEEVKIKVTIPKFKFDYNKNLKTTLQTLGIRSIFTNEASLPGLARGGDVAGKLKVSNIYQKSGIDVNEKGTEAYASTVVEIDNKFGGATILEEFTVNRPFIFFIEEEATGNLLFAGKVLDPFV